MTEKEPFQPEDLEELDELLSRARAVTTMESIAAGDWDGFNDVIGMRHDVDNVIEPAVEMAHWEAERGYTSTYFILHTSPYWQHKELLVASLEQISGCGHEIGFHINALTAAIVTGRDPVDIAAEAVGELRGYGFHVHGVVAHGDKACHQYGFVNDEIFLESARPLYGAPRRHIMGNVTLAPISRRELGFDYDPNWIDRGGYLSDSGGEWSQPFEDVAARFPLESGRLHMLVHPDWWGEAFAPVKQAT